MTTQMYRVQIKPLTAFATPLRGDTLFGQVCWHIQQAEGSAALSERLAGYQLGSPFLVFADAFPAGMVPRPALPLARMGLELADPAQRKAAKGRRWLPVQALAEPMEEWHRHLATEAELATALPGQHSGQPLWQQQTRTHNSINRLTQTTGSGEQGFAPYERQLTWYNPALTLDLYAVLGEQATTSNLEQWLSAVGMAGYGKEASSGLGKFEVTDIAPFEPPQPAVANAWLTLAPCAPQGGDWRPQHCFYQTHVRFGIHGGQVAAAGQVPWKNPVLLADTAALLTPVQAPLPRQHFAGAGLGGLSRAVTATVHQGYSPVLPVQHAMAEHGSAEETP